MQAQLRHDPARGAGYGVIDVNGFEGRDTDILFSLRRASDGKYLGTGDWLEAELVLTPDVVQHQGDTLRLLVGPAVVDMVDALNTFAITVYSAGGEDRRCGLEVGALTYSHLAGGQGVAQTATAPLSMSPMPEMRLEPAPVPQPELEPEPVPLSEASPEAPLPELKDPVEHTSKMPLFLLLLLLVCVAGGVYWWKFVRITESAPPVAGAAAPALPGAPSVSVPQAAAPELPSKELPPLERARELLRAGAPPEQAVELAKEMQSPAGADGAFLLLEDAAQKGNPEAMLGLARFYDPADTAPKGSILSDPAQAREWYDRAKDKGQEAAEDKLKALRAWAEGEKSRNPQARLLLDSWK